MLWPSLLSHDDQLSREIADSSALTWKYSSTSTVKKWDVDDCINGD